MGFILAHIGDYELEASLRFISSKLGVRSQSIKHFIDQIIGNHESKSFVIDDNQSVVLPPELLCKSEYKPTVNVWEASDFNINADYIVKRPDMPISINLMITTRCTTDCIYCYADRTLQPIMDTNKIIDLIEELHNGGVINITLTGGDIFTRKDWPCILKKLRQYGYFPYLSTKTPINESEIAILKKFGYEEIQFSLDTNSESILKELVKAPNGYFKKVKEFLKNADKFGLKVLVRSVLTRLNSDIEKVNELYKFLSGYDAVKEWTITPAFFSKYKEDKYKRLEVQNSDLKEIYLLARQENLKFPIGLNKISKNGYKLKDTENIEDFVRRNQICLANTTGMSILANGKCSVCEMLYEDEEFLLGDVHESSIRDIWNSSKALELYFLNQQTIDSTSPCIKCTVFSECRHGYGKRICYLDIKKSGKSSSFPDPRCPMADDYNIIF